MRSRGWEKAGAWTAAVSVSPVLSHMLLPTSTCSLSVDDAPRFLLISIPGCACGRRSSQQQIVSFRPLDALTYAASAVSDPHLRLSDHLAACASLWPNTLGLLNRRKRRTVSGKVWTWVG